MTSDREPFETNAPGPFLLIRAGGPLQGVVTLTTIQGGHRSIVEASWVRDGQGRSDSVEVDAFDQARELAHSVADGLAAGTPPDLSRD